MRCLITGAGGFVGANLVRRLLDDGHECHVLLRPGGRRWRLEGILERLVVHEADLIDRAQVTAAVARAAPDRIYHLAVYGAYSFERDFDRIVDTNVRGTEHILGAAVESGCPVVVNTGSSAEYGDRDHAPSEDETLEPDSHYAITKAAGTWLARHAAKHNPGLRAPTIRMYSAYGPFEDPRRLIPTLLMHCLDGRLPPLAPPTTVRDFVHVDDVVDAYLLCGEATLEDAAPVFNVGSGTQVTLAELVALARELFGIEAEPDWGAYQSHSWDTAVWLSDPAKIQRELGWRQRTGLRDGLASTAGWLRENRQRYLDSERGGP